MTSALIPAGISLLKVNNRSKLTLEQDVKYIRKNVFASLLSVHNTISLHVMNILIHDVINLLQDVKYVQS